MGDRARERGFTRFDSDPTLAQLIMMNVSVISAEILAFLHYKPFVGNTDTHLYTQQQEKREIVTLIENKIC